MTDHIGEATKKVIDLDALEKLADEAERAVERIDGGDGWTMTHQGPDEFYGTYREIGAAKFFGPASEEQSAFTEAASPATIKTLIAELKALQAFAADEIAFAFCAGFNDAIDREKWDDCYDFAASKAGDYRNDRIRAFLARNGKGEG